MKTIDLLKISAAYSVRRKSRTILTVLGVIIGCMCIVLMLSIGYSNYKQFNDMLLNNASLTQIEIYDYSNAGITDKVLADIVGINHVKAVSPVIGIPAKITVGEYEANTQIEGINQSVLQLDFAEGSSFPENSSMPYMIIGGNSVNQFIDPKNPPDYYDYEEYDNYAPDIDWLNSEFEITFGYEIDDDSLPDGRVYHAKVAGVTEKNESNADFKIYVSLDMAKEMIKDNRELAAFMNIPVNSYTSAIIKVDEMSNVDPVLDEIKKMGFEVYSDSEYITQMQEEQSRQQGQLLAIGLISLIVSAIGIANSMYANILERRRDIGIMKVLGLSVAKIRNIFLVESALIGLIGGIVGLGISFIVVLVINTGTEQTSFLGMYFSSGMSIEIPSWVALTAIAISLSVGMISGFYPAAKAAAISPLDAMRNIK